MAYCRVNGMSEVFLELFDCQFAAAESTVLDVTDATQLAQKEAKEMNDRAMQALILASKNDIMMNHVKKGMKIDPNWPGGKAWQVYKELCVEYQPDDDVADADLEEELMKIKFKSNENPKTIKEKMASLEVKYNLTILESKKRALVVRLTKSKYTQSLRQADRMQEMSGDQWRFNYKKACDFG